jgi:hypothetical protein
MGLNSVAVQKDVINVSSQPHRDLTGFRFGHVLVRNGAKRRGYAFKVTIEEAWALFLTQDRKCALSGVSLKIDPSDMRAGATTASLDRIDSRKGYISGNVQWVHVSINLMKQTLTVAEFVAWCSCVATHQSACVSKCSARAA